MKGSRLQHYWHVQSVAKLLISTWVAVILSTFMSLIYISDKILHHYKCQERHEMHPAANIHVPQIAYVLIPNFKGLWSINSKMCQNDTPIGLNKTHFLFTNYDFVSKEWLIKQVTLWIPNANKLIIHIHELTLRTWCHISVVVSHNTMNKSMRRQFISLILSNEWGFICIIFGESQALN